MTIAAAAAVLMNASLTQAAPDLDEFSIVFSDEFNGSELDSEKWNTGFLWGPYLPINNEEQLYIDELGINAPSMQSNGGLTPSPFEFTGNSLKIVAIPVNDPSEIPARPNENNPIWENYPEYRFNGDDPNDPNDSYYDPDNVKYLSGIITSYDSFRFTHGYAEARVKLPAGQGLWPAFWLLNSFYVEDVPEIDIMEFLGHDKETLYHTYHYFETQNNWNKVSTPSFTSTHSDFTADWHTFGLTWDPEEIVWYVDGIEARRISANDYTIPNQAMYVIANLATGGNWPGSPDSTTPFPAEYELDYIRVYQKDAPDAITQSLLDSDYVLMFEDNFTGSTLDTDKWNTHHLWGPYWQINNEEQMYPDIGDTHADETYISPPVSVSNGSLLLTADTVSSNDLPVMPSTASSAFQNHPEWRHNGAYNNPTYQNSNNNPSEAPAPFLPEYTSGIVTTYDSFKFTHGYAEIRAKLPQGDGLWPAFWLLNGYYVDQQPEIDVIELRGENPQELVHSYHLSPTDGGPPSYSWSTFSNDPSGYADGFHTYSIAWEPGKLDWYVDGVKQHTHTGSSVSTQNMYVILNLAVGGNFLFEPVDSSILPQSMEIDYVKIYQRKVAETKQAKVNNDAQRIAALDSIIDALESYANDTGTYNVAGGGSNGSGVGWFHNTEGNNPDSIANRLVAGNYLQSPAPADPLLTNPGSYSNRDFLLYTCEDRIAVFSLADTIQPTQADMDWWQSNDCNLSPINSRNHPYFKLSQPLPDPGDSDDSQRIVALDSIIDALESYANDTGTYNVAGGGSNGSGVGWFHNTEGNNPDSIANRLVAGNYLQSPAPADPLLTNPGSYSNRDFLVYTCEDRIAVFSLADTIQPTQADMNWWQINDCNLSPINSRNHPYFKLSQPLAGTSP